MHEVDRRCTEIAVARSTRSTYRDAQAQLAAALNQLAAQQPAWTQAAPATAGAATPPPGNAPPILYPMDGGDRALQLTRMWLAEHVGNVISRGLNEFSAPVVHHLANAQHNAAWSYFISQTRIDEHKQEAEALFNFLVSRLTVVPPGPFTNDVASALGIMKNNMLGRIETSRTR